jgi:hypothetical protein
MLARALFKLLSAFNRFLGALRSIVLFDKCLSLF